MNKLLRLLSIFFLVFAVSLEAKNFGKRGQDFEIEEQDFAEAFMQKIQSKLESMDIEAIQQKAFEKAATRLNRPLAVSGLKEASKYQSYFYDPALVVEEDITNLKGQLIAKKGDKIDPTQELGAPEFGILFFDGDNPEHLSWAKKQDDSFNWILVSGAPFELAERENRWVGFDQNGVLTKKFNIKHIPCRVSPSEGQLLIEEIPLHTE